MAEVATFADSASERIPFSAALKFRCEGENEWSYGQAIDLSDRGLLFFCQREVTVYASIEITLLEPVAGVNKTLMRGEVVRVDFLSISGLSNAVAVRFSTD
jgi:hypothetical protein